MVNAVATPKSTSARSVRSGTRPSRYDSMRAISAPPRRPAQLMRMPSAPRPHRRLHRALHGAAERNATLELLRDRFSDELGIELRLRISTMLMTTLEVSASQPSCAASRCRRPSCRSQRPDAPSGSSRGTSCADARSRCARPRPASAPRTVPCGSQCPRAGACRSRSCPSTSANPRPVDAKTQPDRIDLLTHGSLLIPYALAAAAASSTSRHNGEVRERLHDASRAPATARANRFITSALPT